MRGNKAKKPVSGQKFSRRDFLKLSSLTMGVLALPRTVTSMIEETLAAQGVALSSQNLYFQWQNEFLRQTIYRMREIKLRDFLVFYQQVDVWSYYKGKDINALKEEVSAYKMDWEADHSAALRQYT